MVTIGGTGGGGGGGGWRYECLPEILGLALAVMAVGFSCMSVSGSKTQLFENDRCALKSGKLGVCLRANKCAWVKTSLESHAITHADLIKCGFVGDELIICCHQDDSLARTGERSANGACEGYDGVQSRLAFHIIGGYGANHGEVPFIGALGYHAAETDTYVWACGGTLIAPRFVLTAAHCINSAHGRPRVVRMGTTNLIKSADPAAVQDRSIEQHFVHPAYKKPRRYHDIALVRVADSFVFDDVVHPACLHPTATDLGPTTTLLAAGWGDNGNLSRTPEGLLKTNLTTVPLAECRTRIEPLYEALHGTLQRQLADGIVESLYCAVGFAINGSNDHSDTCPGDSGGPLYYISNDAAQKYFVVGVTSLGFGCGSGTPAIYARAYYYLDWIASIVWPSEPEATEGSR